MGQWRYYAKRAVGDLWLDVNVQMGEPEFIDELSAPGAGRARILGGLGAPYAEDGRLVWGKWDTLIFAEENEKLKWVGICTAAYPDGGDLKIEFVGFFGWLQRVPFNGLYEVWQRNVFDVVRMLLAYAGEFGNGLDMYPSQNKSNYTVGDVKPPERPKAPTRGKGVTMAVYQASAAYKKFEKDDKFWVDNYADYKKYSLAWWEGPYIGEEIDVLAKQTDFEYRLRAEWTDRKNLKFRLYVDLADDIVTRRDDIAFVDGMNLARRISPKDGDEDYANQVIGLGAGEGQNMNRVAVTNNDGRLYQAEFVQYKAVRDERRLRALVQADLRRFNNKEYAIDQVVVWDVPGFAPLSTLQVGDEVKVHSTATTPATDTWRRVIQIKRVPETPYVTVSLEYTS